jgi:hypothetical protein
LPYEEYRLALARGGNVSSIRLAFAVEMPGSPGNVGIEVVSREGRILAEAVVLLSDFDPQLPVTFPLPSLRFDPRQPWNVRVFSRGSPAPVRVFELRCSRWGGLRRERELFVAVEWSTHDASP